MGRSFFENKVCDVCGRQATMYRTTTKYLRNNFMFMCSSRWCDLVFRKRIGAIEQDIKADSEVDHVVQEIIG